jgi:hypothetical protein
MQNQSVNTTISSDKEFKLLIDQQLSIIVKKKANSTITTISFTDENDVPINIPENNIKVYNNSYKKEIKANHPFTHFDLCWDEYYTITHQSKIIKWNQIPIWNFITSRK